MALVTKVQKAAKHWQIFQVRYPRPKLQVYRMFLPWSDDQVCVLQGIQKLVHSSTLDSGNPLKYAICPLKNT